MKKTILLPAVLVLCLFNGCALLTNAEKTFYKSELKKEFITKPKKSYVVSTNYVVQPEKINVLDEQGNIIGEEIKNVKIPILTTNLIFENIELPILYNEKNLKPEVKSILETTGGFFGPLGEGIAGLGLLALGLYAKMQNIFKRKKAEQLAQKEIDLDMTKKTGYSLIESVEIAKDIINEIDEQKLKAYIDKIKRHQNLSGTRESIRNMFLNNFKK